MDPEDFAQQVADWTQVIEPFFAAIPGYGLVLGNTSSAARGMATAYLRARDGDYAAAERELIGAFGAIAGRTMVAPLVETARGEIIVASTLSGHPEMGLLAGTIIAITISGLGTQTGEAVTEALTDAIQDAVADGESLVLEDMIRIAEQAASGHGLPLIDSLLNLRAPLDSCFAAGTEIAMADGSVKLIEAIGRGDAVLSYTENGDLVCGHVRESYVRKVSQILDVFGTFVTPGHVTLCSDGPFAGRHVALLDILRSDGAVMRADGQKIRAATECAVGSSGDRLVAVVAGKRRKDGTIKKPQSGLIRLGTRVVTADGLDVSLQDLMKASGATITDTGFVVAGEGPPQPIYWPFSDILPKPEDYVLARSGTSLSEIYAANEWEAVAPMLPPPDVAAQPLRQNRRRRRALKAKSRRQAQTSAPAV